MFTFPFAFPFLPPRLFVQSTAPNQPKTFIDKIADALLGGDEQSPASKYALICQKCFAHNGLVLKDEVMDVRECPSNLYPSLRPYPKKLLEAKSDIPYHRIRVSTMWPFQSFEKGENDGFVWFVASE